MEKDHDPVENSNFLKKKQTWYENDMFRILAQQTYFKRWNLSYQYGSAKFSLTLEPKEGHDWPLLSHFYEALD
jgi:hypothetical protein